MKTSHSFIGMILILVALGSPSLRFVSLPSQQVRVEQIDCEGVFSQLIRDEDWMGQLVDPVLYTQAQVAEKLRLYSQVHDCISDSNNSDILKTIRKLTEYFLIFAGGFETPGDGSTFYLVNLATDNDPAVLNIRQKVGISPPPGYVYVRFYRTRQAMPDLLKLSFENPDVRGVTIYNRYVAVLADNSDLRSKALPKTISHELVHAYLKSVQGVKNLDAFPLWYDEGMAVHFSGSSLPSCIYTYYGTGTITSCTTSPEDYVQYAANFDFLEAKLGHARFLELVKQSFDEFDPTMLYLQLGYATYQDFSVHAREWEKRHAFLTKAALGGACLVPLIIGLLFYFWRAGTEEAEETPKPPQFPDLPYQSL
jgi:hypothetical protein